MIKAAKEELNYAKEIEGIDLIGKEEWTTIYGSVRDGKKWNTVFCCLTQNSNLNHSLEKPMWDMHIGDGNPGISFVYENGNEKWVYQRFSKDKVEPFIFQRDFFGIKENYYEISEEFRLFHNLFEDKASGKLIFIDDNGDEEDAVIFEEDNIRVKTRLLKEYLSARDMSLLVFFEFDKYSQKTLTELRIKEEEKIVNKEGLIYSLNIFPHDFSDDRKTIGRLIGKKVVRGLKKYEPSLYGKEEKFEEFVVDIDEDGNTVYSTCDEGYLKNYFGANPEAYHYLTPVMFKKEVLARYYNNPEKYKVRDSLISCGSLWSLRMDNNLEEYVMVYLGDLGHLTHKEQLYWKAFNVHTRGLISNTAWKRDFESEFVQPDNPEQYFKNKLEKVNEDWEKKFGWFLFKPLSGADKHHLSSLHVPVSESQKEFDESVLSLSKVIIESLNEKELSKQITVEKDDKGIDKFEKFLHVQGYNIPDLINFLRDLQELRSCSSAHLKGKKYIKIKEKLEINEKELKKSFRNILIKAIWSLNTINSYFL